MTTRAAVALGLLLRALSAPAAAAELDPERAHGRALVAANLCLGCHAPDAGQGDAPPTGGRAGGWSAPDLTGDARLGLGAWSVADIVAYLGAGVSDAAIASGPMADVVRQTTSRMPAEALRAIAAYLRSIPAAGLPPPAPLAADAPAMRAGGAIYRDACAACHGRDGAGVPGLFPRLARSPAVVQDDPTTLLRALLAGARGVATDAAPTGPAMAPPGRRLNDRQLADVATYLRNNWGNAAAPIEADDVARLRARVAAE